MSSSNGAQSVRIDRVLITTYLVDLKIENSNDMLFFNVNYDAIYVFQIIMVFFSSFHYKALFIRSIQYSLLKSNLHIPTTWNDVSKINKSAAIPFYLLIWQQRR